MSAIKDRNTITPASETTDQIAGLFTMLTEARAGDEALFLSVAGNSDANRFVMIPDGVADMIGRIITSLHAGQPISVLPHDLQVTTQEAADLLGLSRPTVIKLVNEGELACELVGSHRRLAIADVMAYRNRRRAAVQEMLEATQLDDDLVDAEDLRDALRIAKASPVHHRREG
jgi:excisionase family DNA binding protein